MDLKRIDSMLAEKVMGWTRPDYTMLQTLLQTWAQLDRPWLISGDNSNEPHLLPEDAWHPTTDGDGALAVVERMAALGYAVQIKSGKAGGFWAGFHRETVVYFYSAVTITVAISLAALCVFLTREEFAEVTQ